MPGAYDLRAADAGKSKKQSMADLKLRRLNELNSRLKEDLERPRIKVSEASMSLIQYCTNTKDFMVPSMWGSFAQELLSTFSTSLGEVALIPSTGGVFTVDLVHIPKSPSPEAATETSQDLASVKTTTVRLWDRKAEGGFPEVKHLKQLVRNQIDPSRDLGHSDTPAKSLTTPSTTTTTKDSPSKASLPEAPKPSKKSATASTIGSTDRAPLPSSATAPQQEVQDLKATVPQGLHIAPDPGVKVQGGRIEGDESAGRKETVTVTDANADAGVTGEVGETKGREGECEDCI